MMRHKSPAVELTVISESTGRFLIAVLLLKRRRDLVKIDKLSLLNSFEKLSQRSCGFPNVGDDYFLGSIRLPMPRHDINGKGD
jgi:hypothetical protein